MTSDDIKEGMAEQGVTDVCRITVHRDGVIKQTNIYVLTFNSPNLPTVVDVYTKPTSVLQLSSVWSPRK